MEKFATIETAQDLFEFLQTIRECEREQLYIEVYAPTDDGILPTYSVEAIQIFEDGVPVSMFRISKDND